MLIRNTVLFKTVDILRLVNSFRKVTSSHSVKILPDHEKTLTFTVVACRKPQLLFLDKIL